MLTCPGARGEDRKLTRDSVRAGSVILILFPMPFSDSDRDYYGARDKTMIRVREGARRSC